MKCTLLHWEWYRVAISYTEILDVSHAVLDVLCWWFAPVLIRVLPFDAQALDDEVDYGQMYLSVRQVRRRVEH